MTYLLHNRNTFFIIFSVLCLVYCSPNENSSEYRILNNELKGFYTERRQNIELLILLYEEEKKQNPRFDLKFEDWKFRYLESRGSDGVDPIDGVYSSLSDELESIGVNFNNFKFDLGYPISIKNWSSKYSEAIQLASTSSTYSKEISNEDYIKSSLKKRDGIVQVKGFKARLAGEGIFIVSYEFDDNDTDYLYLLEVNLPLENVRNVFQHELLLEKYWDINKKYKELFK